MATNSPRSPLERTSSGSILDRSPSPSVVDLEKTPEDSPSALQAPPPAPARKPSSPWSSLQVIPGCKSEPNSYTLVIDLDETPEYSPTALKSPAVRARWANTPASKNSSPTTPRSTSSHKNSSPAVPRCSSKNPSPAAADNGKDITPNSKTTSPAIGDADFQAYHNRLKKKHFTLVQEVNHYLERMIKNKCGGSLKQTLVLEEPILFEMLSMYDEAANRLAAAPTPPSVRSAKRLKWTPPSNLKNMKRAESGGSPSGSGSWNDPHIIED